MLGMSGTFRSVGLPKALQYYNHVPMRRASKGGLCAIMPEPEEPIAPPRQRRVVLYDIAAVTVLGIRAA